MGVPSSHCTHTRRDAAWLCPCRYDESSDAVFYEGPRFVTHIDDGAIGALTAFYAEHLPPCGDQRPEDTAVLDICSSWISHYPGRLAGRVAGAPPLL